ncbi:hypothetical protein FDP41_009332 [Naegleria fowleri]|uniref:Uncharacterized protein n=1 Tax=Naegleria fowleri TaxID=5763 RepID=A0A6A5BHD6_NAEFO|nr:uncharacterized protein FDP41_009332 [Naegleria fowleri]KAF0972429.1 hypothetical protein FDP41_009332 [Naegleria fowleri]CAG4717596.1 unnamed protein product [Naegleria fowleri]
MAFTTTVIGKPETPSDRKITSSTRSSSWIALLKYLFSIIQKGTEKSAQFLWVVLKAMITSMAPSLNIEITTTPSIEQFPRSLGLNTKMFLTLDYSVPLVVNIKSPTHPQNAHNNNIRRIVYEKQH